MNVGMMFRCIPEYKSGPPSPSILHTSSRTYRVDLLFSLLKVSDTDRAIHPRQAGG